MLGGIFYVLYRKFKLKSNENFNELPTEVSAF